MPVGSLQRYGLSLANVVASGIATGNITPGRTLNNLRYKLGGGALTKAMITALILKANGKIIVNTNGSDLDKINAYRGETVNAAYLDVPFSDYRMEDEIDRHVGAFDTSMGISQITQEVTIAGATTPSLSTILTESAAQKDTSGAAAAYAGLIAKLLQWPFNVSTGGQLSIQLPYGAQSGSIIKRLHFFNTNITSMLIKEDGLTIHESTSAENSAYLTRMGRAPQSGVYHVDFCVDGKAVNGLDTRRSKSLEVLATFSGSDSGRVYAELWDPLQNN